MGVYRQLAPLSLALIKNKSFFFVKMIDIIKKFKRDKKNPKDKIKITCFLANISPDLFVHLYTHIYSCQEDAVPADL